MRGVHGVGGIWGSVAVGLWATKAVNANGVNGLFYGNPHQLMIQVKAVAIAAGVADAKERFAGTIANLGGASDATLAGMVAGELGKLTAAPHA